MDEEKLIPVHPSFYVLFLPEAQATLRKDQPFFIPYE
jgi:hypothetical protein